MIDNYSGQEDTGLTEALEKSHAEKERILKVRSQRLFWTVIIGMSGIALLGWFDWRVGVGVFLLLVADSRK